MAARAPKTDTKTTRQSVAATTATTPKAAKPSNAATTALDPGDKAVWVCDSLDAEYGALLWRSHGEPMGALVMTILSQHTSDANSERAYDGLRRAYPTWDAVREAPAPDIADAIRNGGLADAKAPRIKNVLTQIHEATGATNLDFLETMPTGEAKEYLLGFHGVGPKTAACVLMFSLKRPVLPVDTHVFRVSHRLGLIEKRVGEAKAHDLLEAQLPPERVYAFHVHMIRHGRRVCIAQRPRCSACVLRERCDYFQSGAATTVNAEAAQPAAPKRAPKTVAAAPATRTTLHGLPPSGDLPQTDARGDEAGAKTV